MTHTLSGAGRYEPFDGTVPFPSYDDIVAERVGEGEAMMRADFIAGSNGADSARRIRRMSLLFRPNSWGVELYSEKDDVIAAKDVPHSHVYSTHTPERLVAMVGGERMEFDTRPMIELLTTVTQTMYVGSFRNAINSGGGAVPCGRALCDMRRWTDQATIHPPPEWQRDARRPSSLGSLACRPPEPHPDQN